MNTQYKTKLRSSNTAKKISESKPDIMSSKTKSEIPKRPRKFEIKTRYSKIKVKCSDCNLLINKDEMSEHKETCERNQKKCIYCQEFFPSRLISSHLNVCNTGTGNLPNINRNVNPRVNEPKNQSPPFIGRKPSNNNHPESHPLNENSNHFGTNFERNNNLPNNNSHIHNNRTNNSNNAFPNINNSNNRRPNNASNNLHRENPFSIFEEFSNFNPQNSSPPFLNRFNQDTNGNNFYFSNEFSNSDPNINNNNNNATNNANANMRSNTFQQPPQQERERMPYSHVFFQRGNNNGNTFFSSNNNSSENFSNNLNANPFSDFNRIFGPTGVFTRIRDEMRNLINAPGLHSFPRNFASYRTMPFEREESENNRIFDSFSFFIDNPIFVTFRNSRDSRARGLNEEEINNIPTSTFNSAKPNNSTQEKKEHNSTNKSCVVCLDDFKTGDQLKALVCGHKFHKNCIDHWLPIKGSCPICRVDLSRAET